MKIKNTAIWLCLLFSAAVASCQEISEEKYKIRGSVTHEDQSPVESARMMSFYIKRSAPGSFVGEPTRTEIVETGSNGKATLEFTSLPTPDGAVAFGKKGYYGTTARAVWKSAGQKSWGAEVFGILKPVKNPIPMYAYDNKGGMEKIVNIPEIGKRYGFDLMLAEALPPLGNGKTADFTFFIEGVYEKTGFYDMKLKILFASPLDGVVEFKTPQRTGMREPHMLGSQLLSDHIAPENGYVSEIARTIRRKSLAQPPEKNDDIHRNFYFRTRTKLDSNGKIISAHYGKIYGDFHFMGANVDWGYFASLVLVTTYFNPTPNDRNVEFDTKRNLLPDGNVQRP